MVFSFLPKNVHFISKNVHFISKNTISCLFLKNVSPSKRHEATAQTSRQKQNMKKYFFGDFLSHQISSRNTENKIAMKSFSKICRSDSTSNCRWCEKLLVDTNIDWKIARNNQYCMYIVAYGL